MRIDARWLLLVLLLPARLAALEAPALDTTRGGLALSRLPAILSAPEVRRELGHNLTVSFVFEAVARGSSGPKVRGAARIAIRYEPWQEKYLVSRIDATGGTPQLTLPSFEALADWWRNTRLVLLRQAAVPDLRKVEVRLRVIPFSEAERQDAQRWFSQALSHEKSGSAGAVSEAVEDQPESFSQVLNLLLTTSIGRPTLLEHEWKIALPSGRTRK